MWDTLIIFWNMGIQSFLIFGDNCRIFFKAMGYFFKKINGIWDTGTPPSRASLVYETCNKLFFVPIYKVFIFSFYHYSV